MNSSNFSKRLLKDDTAGVYVPKSFSAAQNKNASTSRLSSHIRGP